MKKLLYDKSGGVPIIFIGLLFFLLLMSVMIMEMGAAYESYYDAETILQRCCNSAVESNILDEYRLPGLGRIYQYYVLYFHQYHGLQGKFLSHEPQP